MNKWKINVDVNKETLNTKQIWYKTKYSLQIFSVCNFEEDNTNASYMIFP